MRQQNSDPIPQSTLLNVQKGCGDMVCAYCWTTHAFFKSTIFSIHQMSVQQTHEFCGLESPHEEASVKLKPRKHSKTLKVQLSNTAFRVPSLTSHGVCMFRLDQMLKKKKKSDIDDTVIMAEAFKGFLDIMLFVLFECKARN